MYRIVGFDNDFDYASCCEMYENQFINRGIKEQSPLRAINLAYKIFVKGYVKFRLLRYIQKRFGKLKISDYIYAKCSRELFALEEWKRELYAKLQSHFAKCDTLNVCGFFDFRVGKKIWQGIVDRCFKRIVAIICYQDAIDMLKCFISNDRHKIDELHIETKDSKLVLKDKYNIDISNMLLSLPHCTTAKKEDALINVLINVNPKKVFLYSRGNVYTTIKKIFGERAYFSLDKNL